MSVSIPYGKQYIDEADIQAVVEALRGDYLTTGPRIKEFEHKFAQYIGVKYAVAVSSGTAALHLACLAAGFKAGDEVITTPMSFAATANSVLYTRARPVFADIDPQTYNIDPAQVEARLSNKTRGIIPVHYTGLPCDLERIRDIAQKQNLVVIEDACHALGARYKSSTIGDCRFSNMTVFSFHPVKHITTGEGGMITTNSQELYKSLLALRSHGIVRDEADLLEANHGPWYYEMQDLGFNYRMTDIQAALGISQIDKLDYFLKRRRQIAAYYSESLADLPLELPVEPEDCHNSYHLYVIKINPRNSFSRKEIYFRLKDRGIHTQVHYIPIHTFPYYREALGCQPGDFPLAEDHYTRILSIPIFPKMTDEEVKTVVKTLREVIR
ncbi:MAG: UDP-4-amino-4,6-dideoxy-N-acetyl-beta-L-altrosamine transaminase [Syntrophomonas sp.]